jgi:hypothetical protein
MERIVIIDSDHIEHWTGYAQGLIRLAVQDQAKHQAQLLKHEAAKTAATEAAKLAKEVAATSYPADLSEIDRLEAECEMLNQKIDSAGVDRAASVDGAGKQSHHPLVTMLRQARWRLKQAVDTRDRVAVATGSKLFGRNL